MIVDLDVVNGTKIRRTNQTLEIRRSAIVSQIPIDCTNGTDPNVLIKALEAPGLPQPYSVFPNVKYPAVLEDYELDSVRSVDTVVLTLVYRLNLSVSLTANVNWIQEEDIQTYISEVYTTARKTTPLYVYYKAGAGVGTNVIPSDAHARIGKARKHEKVKTLVVRGKMYLSAWLALKPIIEPMELCINSVNWGNSTRGQWLYLGHKIQVPLPTGLAPNTIIIATVELHFLKEPLGHYPLLVYLNERREHPKDAKSESILRGLGLPAVDQLRMTNGKTLASIYPEADFNGAFQFTPL
jgi:hypothetical protein